MSHLGIYKVSLALLTDLYELTMAQGYWEHGMEEYEAVFHVTFRKAPFQGGYTIAAGLGSVVEYLQRFGFDDEDVDYLATLKGSDGKPLFKGEFLRFLREMEFRCDVDAVPEGTVVFAHEPLVRISGPLLQAQILETALLNIMNFQTLIATKAARICFATGGEDVLEFGLRRAQGIDGGISASRAAIIGGCAATSNVLAGRLFGVPVRGTHAHSWVMSFETEREAFMAYAKAMPNNAVLLVDTYDTLEGVKLAVETGHWLREQGHDLAGIRLDSGDLAWLSIEARRILDEAGFEGAKIVASSDLEEYTIRSLKEQGAQIAVWGVGTQLATAYNQPALGGVYKLSALRKPGGEWMHKIKLSEQRVKISNPGRIQVRRFEEGGEYVGDMIFDELLGAPSKGIIIDPLDDTRRKRLEGKTYDLLVPVFREGKLIAEEHLGRDLMEIQERVKSELGRFYDGIKRFEHPHQYPAGLELSLHELKTALILEARGFKEEGE